jgi:DNA-binding transcriptional MerR regulator
MGYSIKELADIAGVSRRALRWYEKLGMLRPVRLENGYREYGSADVDRLQTILFYRELDLPLSRIATLLKADDCEAVSALSAHLDVLRSKRRRLDEIISTMETTIAAKTRGETMKDIEKFEAFKADALRKNEEAFGTEIRAKYGERVVDAANAQFVGLGQDQYEELETLTEKLHVALRKAVASGDAKSDSARKVAEMHRQWLSYYWPDYSVQKHKGVTQMYVDDPRFSAYYEKVAPGAAQFLRDAVWALPDDS